MGVNERGQLWAVKGQLFVTPKLLWDSWYQRKAGEGGDLLENLSAREPIGEL